MAFQFCASCDVKAVLEARQAEAIQAIREAFDVTMDKLPLPDLVIAKIWKSDDKPDVGTSRETDWLDGDGDH